MAICAFLALVSGLVLLYTAFGTFNMVLLLFLLLGLAAIAAAVRYTVGNSPYGYRSLGDVYVFLFFGLAGVVGTYFLHAGNWPWSIMLPAATIGFFSAGVLNLNNIRDLDSDAASGKITLVVRLGQKAARWYHLFLIGAGWLCMLVFIFFFVEGGTIWPLFLSLPLFARNVWLVMTVEDTQLLDPELRNLPSPPSCLCCLAPSCFCNGRQ